MRLKDFLQAVFIILIFGMLLFYNMYSVGVKKTKCLDWPNDGLILSMILSVIDGGNGTWNKWTDRLTVLF